MPVEINGLPVTVLRNPKDGAPVQNGRGSSGVPQPEKAPASDSDTLSLTEAPARLRELQQSLESVPVVDAKRVEGIKTAIANGSYEINPERVADKLVRFERALGDK